MADPKFVFVELLQFSTLTSRCRLHHNQRTASSLMDILFSALVAVLRRVRSKEIEKPKQDIIVVCCTRGLNEVRLASTLGTKAAERKRLKDNSRNSSKI